MPTWYGPGRAGAAWRSGNRRDDWFWRHYGPVMEGVNVFLYSDGSVSEASPTAEQWPNVAHALWGAHVEPITDDEAALLTAAGYGQYITQEKWMDANGVFQRCVSATGELNTTVVVGTPDSASLPGKFDENYVWSQVFDVATNTIRVVAV